MDGFLDVGYKTCNGQLQYLRVLVSISTTGAIAVKEAWLEHLYRESCRIKSIAA